MNTENLSRILHNAIEESEVGNPLVAARLIEKALGHVNAATLEVWQPFETAPKDGSEFLALWSLQGDVKMLLSWNRVHKYWQSKGKPELHVHATHWMAIPQRIDTQQARAG